MIFFYIIDRLLWCSLFIGADRCHKRLLRVSELLWRLFWGSSCCQRPPEVRRSGRLVSLSSSLPVLLGHAAALLQRNQRVHRRDRGPDRLPRPAQEGQNKLTESHSFRFVSVRGNTVSCQTTERMKLFLFQWRVCVQMLFSSSGKSPNLTYSWQLWYETKRYVNENQYFHQVVFARSRRSMYVHVLLTSCLCPSGRRIFLAHPPAGGPDHEGDPGAVPPVQEPPGVQRWGRPAGGLVQTSGVEGWCDLRCDGGEGELEVKIDISVRVHMNKIIIVSPAPTNRWSSSTRTSCWQTRTAPSTTPCWATTTPSSASTRTSSPSAHWPPASRSTTPSRLTCSSSGSPSSPSWACWLC